MAYKRRVIIVGGSGNGKSATGNTLLKIIAFNSRMSLSAVTTVCLRAEHEDQYQSMAAVDTPGLFDAGSSIVNRALAIQRSLELCQHPHCFLLVLKPDRLMDTDIRAIDMLEIIFGPSFFEHCIVVVTHGDEIPGDLIVFGQESREFKSLVNKCGNRICKFENSPNSQNKERYKNNLLTMIDTLSKYGRKVYTIDDMDVRRDVLQKHANDVESTRRTHEYEIRMLLQDIRDTLKRKFWKKIYIAAVSALICIAIGGLLYWFVYHPSEGVTIAKTTPASLQAIQTTLKIDVNKVIRVSSSVARNVTATMKAVHWSQIASSIKTQIIKILSDIAASCVDNTLRQLVLLILAAFARFYQRA